MTELIVALDGPQPLTMLSRLYHEAHVRWFKVGPQTLVDKDFLFLMDVPDYYPNINIFADFKLADTYYTCSETVKRLSQANIHAVSTFTERATEAAMNAAQGTNLQVWRVAGLTDDEETPRLWEVNSLPDGLICSWEFAYEIKEAKIFTGNIIVPGVRLFEGTRSETITHIQNNSRFDHNFICTPRTARDAGATHAVVGRPIWRAEDPSAAAVRYMKALEE